MWGGGGGRRRRGVTGARAAIKRPGAAERRIPLARSYSGSRSSSAAGQRQQQQTGYGDGAGGAAGPGAPAPGPPPTHAGEPRSGSAPSPPPARVRGTGEQPRRDPPSASPPATAHPRRPPQERRGPLLRGRGGGPLLRGRAAVRGAAAISPPAVAPRREAVGGGRLLCPRPGAPAGREKRARAAPAGEGGLGRQPGGGEGYPGRIKKPEVGVGRLPSRGVLEGRPFPRGREGERSLPARLGSEFCSRRAARPCAESPAPPPLGEASGGSGPALGLGGGGRFGGTEAEASASCCCCCAGRALPLVPWCKGKGCSSDLPFCEQSRQAGLPAPGPMCSS